MSDTLLDQLENKLVAAVDTIEAQRKEIEELKEERQLLEDALKEERQVMEDKLRGLITRIDQAGSAPHQATAEAETPAHTPYGGSATPYSGGGSDF